MPRSPEIHVLSVDTVRHSSVYVASSALGRIVPAGGLVWHRVRPDRLTRPERTTAHGGATSYAFGMSSPYTLAETLMSVSESEYARFVADWLTRAGDLDDAPPLVQHPVIDALVAAAAAHASMKHGMPPPSWANEPARALGSFWYAGPPGFFAHALVHSPLSFVTRGVLVEEDSLESV